MTQKILYKVCCMVKASVYSHVFVAQRIHPVFDVEKNILASISPPQHQAGSCTKPLNLDLLQHSSKQASHTRRTWSECTMIRRSTQAWLHAHQWRWLVRSSQKSIIESGPRTSADRARLSVRRPRMGHGAHVRRVSAAAVGSIRHTRNLFFALFLNQQQKPFFP